MPYFAEVVMEVADWEPVFYRHGGREIFPRAWRARDPGTMLLSGHFFVTGVDKPYN